MKVSRKKKGGRFVAWARGAFLPRGTNAPASKKPGSEISNVPNAGLSAKG
jgi:hypothetical protein